MPLISKINPDDGVITVSYLSSDGRTADVADFYIRPLMEGLDMSRMGAVEWQQQFAALFIAAYQRHFTPPDALGKQFPEIR